MAGVVEAGFDCCPTMVTLRPRVNFTVEPGVTACCDRLAGVCGVTGVCWCCCWCSGEAGWLALDSLAASSSSSPPSLSLCTSSVKLAGMCLSSRQSASAGTACCILWTGMGANTLGLLLLLLLLLLAVLLCGLVLAAASGLPVFGSPNCASMPPSALMAASMLLLLRVLSHGEFTGVSSGSVLPLSMRARGGLLSPSPATPVSLDVSCMAAMVDVGGVWF